MHHKASNAILAEVSIAMVGTSVAAQQRLPLQRPVTYTLFFDSLSGNTPPSYPGHVLASGILHTKACRRKKGARPDLQQGLWLCPGTAEAPLTGHAWRRQSDSSAAGEPAAGTAQLLPQLLCPPCQLLHIRLSEAWPQIYTSMAHGEGAGGLL